ncbi:mycofactocin precursor MftA [Rubrobacter indicoceani]|uniref:mycofactocin precursor MftA n=1 Tax=Rubrobacter indicoceani TaxID=2051957 RepID=UPI000E5C3BFB|nr:mycofactocin precursor MftA [Rubrobacter indicoceani]
MRDPKGGVTLEERPAGTAYAEKEDASQEGWASDAPEMAEEIMIEEINIDGMCGVY